MSQPHPFETMPPQYPYPNYPVPPQRPAWRTPAICAAVVVTAGLAGYFGARYATRNVQQGYNGPYTEISDNGRAYRSLGR